MAQGYQDLAKKLSGQIVDICQKDTGTTMQVIIDSITCAASPGTLFHVPVSTSLAVALDARRSRAAA